MLIPPPLSALSCMYLPREFEKAAIIRRPSTETGTPASVSAR
jgi:hypothetical protein